MYSLNYISVICYTFLLLLTTSCTLPQGEGRTLHVRLQMPDEFSHLTPEGIEIKLTNTNNGTVYKATADVSGIATFNVEYGIYRMSTQQTYQEDLLRTHLFNAGMENILLTSSQGTEEDIISVTLTNSPLSNIIIKEIYYAGCYDDNGKQYIRDGYVTLYNNSDKMIWLDSLCIGTVAPIVANKVSPWLTYSPDLLPISFIGWQFPGTGHDHPLQPGEEIVIAINAVNHKGTIYNHPNSVDLSKADWAFYNNKLTSADITPGVALLNMFKRIGTINSYAFSISGSCVIIYRIPGSNATDYAGNPKNIQAAPPQYTGQEYLIIPAHWVLDCVDSVEDGTKQGFKRTPSFIDTEATYLRSGKYSGRALHRKAIGNRNGHIIYQDTNNSATDFEECTPTQK